MTVWHDRIGLVDNTCKTENLSDISPFGVNAISSRLFFVLHIQNWFTSLHPITECDIIFLWRVVYAYHEELTFLT